MLDAFSEKPMDLGDFEEGSLGIVQFDLGAVGGDAEAADEVEDALFLGALEVDGEGAVFQDADEVPDVGAGMGGEAGEGLVGGKGLLGHAGGDGLADGGFAQGLVACGVGTGAFITSAARGFGRVPAGEVFFDEDELFVGEFHGVSGGGVAYKRIVLRGCLGWWE
jgi:hypothetical protein